MQLFENPTTLWDNRPGENGRARTRDQFIAALTRQYHYPGSWLEQRIRLVGAKGEEQIDSGLYGFALLSARGDPFLWVSVQPGDAGAAEARLRRTLAADRVARLGVFSDGTKAGTRVLRRRGHSDEHDYLPDLEPFSGATPGSAFRAPGGSAPPWRGLEPISDSLEDVFFQAHSHIRDIDGFHADEALDEVCKLLYTKLFDEEMTGPGEPYALQRAVYGTVEECAAAARRLYHDATEYDIRVFSLRVPGYDRSRGVFNTPLRLSSPALVKVIQAVEPYWLSRSSVDVKGRAFQRVLGPAVRAGMGQYFTPREVIRFVVAVVGPTAADLILDPFSGSGHFLTEALDVVRRASAATDPKRVDEFAFHKLHGIEKSDRMARVAMTDMRLHGDGHSNIRCTDALLAFPNYPDIRPESFDVVMTNPPFGCVLGPEAVGQLAGFSLAEGRGTVPLEVLGLERCVQFLRPGGRLGIVLPDGLFANRNADHVRRWLAGQVKVRAVVSLPIETFAPFGAGVKTSLLFARKWKSGERRATDYPVYLARADRVGYDATGRQEEGSDLPAIADGLVAFIRAEGW